MLTAGCTDSPTGPVETEYRYFPLETGRFVEYAVQEASYAVGKTPVLSSYFLKEVCGSETVGAGGQLQYQIQRYRRTTAQQNWTADSAGFAYLLPDRAVKVENNLPLVKMVFPLYEGLNWNGNHYNTLPPQTYEARFIKTPFTINALSFPESLHIIQQNDSSLVTLVRFTERYAPAVGLIYKENTALNYCQTPNCLGKGIIESGTQKVLRIVAYGKE
ncbi:hypothetical protein Runsl_3486 [Runella slithyformis DSM 19594]|uniref:Uncharacterized protein n=2 Tax=Runella TaxID=105 RepID=A0A7U3ZMB1_RUNSL|nr:hypothetical protein Runsl_3486 [Runella slithyformis DSM 19594]